MNFATDIITPLTFEGLFMAILNVDFQFVLIFGYMRTLVTVDATNRWRFDILFTKRQMSFIEMFLECFFVNGFEGTLIATNSIMFITVMFQKFFLG